MARRKPKEKKDKGKIRIIPLGGLNEVGKNLTVIEYNDDIMIVDCGLGFPDDDTSSICVDTLISGGGFMIPSASSSTKTPLPIRNSLILPLQLPRDRCAG